MTIRERLENDESIALSDYAVLAKNSRGREVEEEPCDIRTVFQRDRDRIIHSKAFRRLKDKTQVFISPEGDHYRTRLTHTLEVAQIGRSIAKALRLNEDLTEAIALGHDLGHTPFGHAGEYALDAVCSEGFKHYEQSIRVVEMLENRGKGLNLTWEVRDGILNHPTKGKPNTLEGKIIRLADKIAYINHDIDDAVRANILSLEDLPQKELKILGFSARDRINNMIHDIVRNSLETKDVFMSPEFLSSMKRLRKYLFENVYIGSKAKTQEVKAQHLLTQLFDYYIENEQLLPQEFRERIETREDSLERVVCDYIAGMTDRFAIKTFGDLFLPTSWKD